MSNNLEALNSELFKALKRINDHSLNDDDFLANELKRANAISKLSSEIIRNAKLTLDFAKVKNDLHHLETPEMFKKAKT